MAKNTDLYIGLTATVDGVDVDSVKVARDTLMNSVKPIEIDISTKKGIKQFKQDYLTLLKQMSVYQDSYNKAISSGATSMQSELLPALKAGYAELERMVGIATSNKINLNANGTDVAKRTLEIQKQAQATSEAKSKVNALSTALKQEANAQKDSANATGIHTTGVKKLGSEAKETATFLDGLKSRMFMGSRMGAQFAAGMAVANAAMQAFRMIMQQTMTTITELNKSMTSVQMVTGSTAEQSYEMFSEYNKMAKELSTTTNTVVQGADDWLRQGKSVEETNILLTASTMQAVIANIEAADSTEKLTATLNGYQMEAEDAMHVIDALSAVDLEAATSVGELATALQKTANTARESGVGFEKLVGYIAAVSENTRQAPELIGNAFRTLFTRMQNVKAGKAIDEYGESLNDVEKVLNRFDIRLRDSQMEFRDMGDVLDDISVKWDGFTSVEKSQIAVSVAGTRQREIFLSLMANYDKALKYNETALNSNGKAAEKYAIYQESVAAALNQLQAAFDELVYNESFINLFKSLISLATSFINILNAISPVLEVVAQTAAYAFDLIGGVFDVISGEAFDVTTEEKLQDVNSELTTLYNNIDEINSRKIKGVLQSEDVVLLEKANKELQELLKKKKALEEQAFREVNSTEVSFTVNENRANETLEVNFDNAIEKYELLIQLMEEEQQMLARAQNDTSQLGEARRISYASNIVSMKEAKASLEDYIKSSYEVIKTQKENGEEISESSNILYHYAETMGFVSDKAEDLTQTIEEATDATTRYSAEINSAIDSGKDAVSAIEAIETALNEYNLTGTVTLASYMKLVEANEEFADAITYTDGKIEVNIDLLKEKGYSATESAKKVVQAALLEQKAARETALITVASMEAMAKARKSYVTATQLAQAGIDIGSLNSAISELEDIYGKLNSINSWNPSSITSSATSSATSKVEEMYKAYVNAITKQLDKEIDALEKEKDEWEDYYDDKIDGINKMIDALDEQEETESKLLEIEEAKAALAKANQEIVRVYVRGQGFVYQKNMEAVASAQDELNILLKEWDTYQKRLELEKQVQDFEDAKNATIKDIDEEIDKLQDLKDKWSDALDVEDDINEYEGLLDYLKEFEEASYEERLEILKDFVDDYNKEVSRMKQPSSISSGGGRGNSSGSNDDDDDYVPNPNTGNTTTTPGGHTVTNTGDTFGKPSGSGLDKLWNEINKYADGTPSAPRTEFAIDGERGPELRVINKGDGILTSKMTKNLMSWGSMNPQAFMSRLPKSTSASSGSPIYQFDFDKLVLPGVSNANELIESLKTKSRTLAIQIQSGRA